MENLDSHVVYQCKYCRAKTQHAIISRSEMKGQKGLVVKCMVCNYEKAIYRIGGRLVMDQSKVPERTIVLPYDKEHIDARDPEVQFHQKDIDEWLKKDPSTFVGGDSAPKVDIKEINTLEKLKKEAELRNNIIHKTFKEDKDVE